VGEEAVDDMLGQFPSSESDQPATRHDLAMLESNIHLEMAGLRTEFHTEIAGLRVELHDGLRR